MEIDAAVVENEVSKTAEGIHVGLDVLGKKRRTGSLSSSHNSHIVRFSSLALSNKVFRRASPTSAILKHPISSPIQDLRFSLQIHAGTFAEEERSMVLRRDELEQEVSVAFCSTFVDIFNFLLISLL